MISTSNRSSMVVAFEADEWQMPTMSTKLELSERSSSSTSDDEESDVDVDEVDAVEETVTELDWCNQSITQACTSSEDSLSSFDSSQEDYATKEEPLDRCTSEETSTQACTCSEQDASVGPSQEDAKEEEDAPVGAMKELEASLGCCALETENSDTSSVTSFGSSHEEEDVPISSKFLRVRKSSIKLASLQTDIPVLTRKNSWKQLPKPDMDKIKRTVSCPMVDFAEETPTRRRSSGVRFQDIHIRSYEQTLGDNPSVSYGPPIQLDWKFEELKPTPIDDYEGKRGGRRKLPQMVLSYYRRMDLLQDAEFSKEECKQAQKAANKDKFKRAVTKCLLPVQVLEDVAQSSVRKTKRYLKGRRQSTV